MKKVFGFAISLVAIFSLTACGGVKLLHVLKQKMNKLLV